MAKKRQKPIRIRYWVPELGSTESIRKRGRAFLREAFGSTAHHTLVVERRKEKPKPRKRRGGASAKWSGGPAITPFRANFYSRNYHRLNRFPLGRYDPWKYKNRPPSSSESPRAILERDELFDDEPHFVWKEEERAHAERYLPGAIASLTSMQRQVYTRRHEENMKMTEIAKDLGICRSAVHSRYSRARERIREYLKKIPKK